MLTIVGHTFKLTYLQTGKNNVIYLMIFFNPKFVFFVLSTMPSSHLKFVIEIKLNMYFQNDNNSKRCFLYKQSINWLHRKRDQLLNNTMIIIIPTYFLFKFWTWKNYTLLVNYLTLKLWKIPSKCLVCFY